ncbi:hypothetical protein ANCDUO_06801 [Ancylostoma duodenale]|uniref:Uncharacterized protein n=1 Tax=Ancylostoma duodenale TaxID=51022 RepID=A0A0C2GNN1_9BILA|nr:hypothetical protein ANCDUO_06801 [Ancylostoma duodenale]
METLNETAKGESSSLLRFSQMETSSMESFGDHIINEDCLIYCTILGPRNIDMNHIDEETLERIHRRLHEYKSIDDAVGYYQDDSIAYTNEFLYCISPVGHLLTISESEKEQ